MKKTKKVFCAIFFLFIFFVNFVFAAEIGNPDAPSHPSVETPGNSELIIITNTVWNTFAYIAQILAIAAIVFAGIRYMFACADKRADIKTQTIILVLGAVLVFAAVPFANFIIGVINQTL